MTLIALLTSLFSRIVSAARPSRTMPLPAVPHAAWREASACRERLLQHDLASWRSSFGI